jgi:hypothetical protein
MRKIATGRVVDLPLPVSALIIRILVFGEGEKPPNSGIFVWIHAVIYFIGTSLDFIELLVFSECITKLPGVRSVGS